MKKLFIITTVSIILVLSAALAPAVAADYPTKSITLINPFPPGGSLDVTGRTFAPLAGAILGQPMIIVNKPGAMGMTGAAVGARANPDGYMLTMGSTAITSTTEWEIVNNRKPAFSRNDFITLGGITLSPALVIVPYNSPWKTLSDLIKDCKAKPDHYAYSTSGPFGMTHVPAELFMRATGLKCRQVAYQGGGPAVTSVVGGHVDFATQYPTSSIPLILGKKLRALAVLGDQRLKSIPDVPTIKELGIDAEYSAWIGIMAPQKTPIEITKKLEQVIAKTVKEKSFIDTIRNTGDEPFYMSGNELAKFWDAESEKLSKLFKQLYKEKESSK